MNGGLSYKKKNGQQRLPILHQNQSLPGGDSIFNSVLITPGTASVDGYENIEKKLDEMENNFDPILSINSKSTNLLSYNKQNYKSLDRYYNGTLNSFSRGGK